MDKQQVLDNIKIARRYLDNFHMLLPDDKILFDCYCLPSYRWKAFYAQVCIERGVCRAYCSYTHYADYWGLESYSQHFLTIENKYHPGLKNDVICKCIFPDMDLINSILCRVLHRHRTLHKGKARDRRDHRRHKAF